MTTEINCKNFCKGAINTDQGMIAMLSDKELIGHSKKNNNCLVPVKTLGPNRMTCPLGCIVLATKNTTKENLIANNTPERVICTRRYHRPVA